jgi:ankyrin repeat protein
MRILATFLCLLLLGGPTQGYAASKEQIREVQELLTALGYDPGSIDGLIGQRTRAALLQAQAYFGFPTDGEISANLLNTLKNENAKGERLFAAAKTGDLDTLNELLAEGINLEARRGPNGFTALHEAIWDKQSSFARALISAGSDIRARVPVGNFEPIHLAAQQGDLSTVEALLASGAPVDARSDDGEVPLHFATATDQVDIVRFLLDNGANVNAVTSKNVTALHVASHFGSVNSAKVLLASGVYSSLSNIDGQTPLHVASARGKRDLVAILLSAGVPTDIKDTGGKTALDLCPDGRWDIGHLLEPDVISDLQSTLVLRGLDPGPIEGVVTDQLIKTAELIMSDPDEELDIELAQTLEDVIIDGIIRHGPGNRFSIDYITPSSAGPVGSVTLEGDSNTLLGVSKVYPRDTVSFVNLSPLEPWIPTGNLSVLRFLGYVEYGRSKFHSLGKTPISFLLLDVGLVYLHGHGEVELASGQVVVLPQ